LAGAFLAGAFFEDLEDFLEDFLADFLEDDFLDFFDAAIRCLLFIRVGFGGRYFE
jgi:hypothetical protein